METNLLLLTSRKKWGTGVVTSVASDKHGKCFRLFETDTTPFHPRPVPCSHGLTAGGRSTTQFFSLMGTVVASPQPPSLNTESLKAPACKPCALRSSAIKETHQRKIALEETRHDRLKCSHLPSSDQTGLALSISISFLLVDCRPFLVRHPLVRHPQISHSLSSNLS